MPTNTIFPLTKEYDTPSEKVIKKSGDLGDTKQALVTTTDMVDKEGKTKQKVVEEAITPPISAKQIDTVNKIDKSQASN